MALLNAMKVIAKSKAAPTKKATKSVKAMKDSKAAPVKAMKDSKAAPVKAIKDSKAAPVAMKAVEAMKAMKESKAAPAKKVEGGGFTCEKCGKQFKLAGLAYDKHVSGCTGPDEASKREFKKGSQADIHNQIAEHTGADRKIVRDVLAAFDDYKEKAAPEEKKKKTEKVKEMKAGTKAAFRLNVEAQSGVKGEDVSAVLEALETVCVETFKKQGKVIIPGICRLTLRTKKAKPAGKRWNPAKLEHTMCKAVKASKTAKAFVLRQFREAMQ